MRPVPLIRRIFGPYERDVAEAYRHIFVDLDDLANTMSTWVPHAQKILEVGCGEGAMTERIVRTYPNASVIAIDISSNVGRLFGGDTSQVTFCQETVEDVARRQPASFDLVVLADVVHHVPAAARQSLISAIDQALVPNGHLVFKDWVAYDNPINWLCKLCERYVTGDDVTYFTTDSFNALMTDLFGPGSIRQVDTVRPWKNNVVVLVRRRDYPAV